MLKNSFGSVVSEWTSNFECQKENPDAGQTRAKSQKPLKIL